MRYYQELLKFLKGFKYKKKYRGTTHAEVYVPIILKSKAGVKYTHYKKFTIPV